MRAWLRRLSRLPRMRARLWWLPRMRLGLRLGLHLLSVLGRLPLVLTGSVMRPRQWMSFGVAGLDLSRAFCDAARSWAAERPRPAQRVVAG